MHKFTNQSRRKLLILKPYGKRSLGVYSLAAWIADLLDQWPALYTSLMKLRHTKIHHRFVSSDHVAVIEAFPRSGSSFAHRAFESANPNARHKIASHVHRSSQVVRATGFGVPCVVLVREPRQAVVSLLALAVQTDQIEMPTTSQARKYTLVTLRRYIKFYQRIEDLSGILVVGFDEVIADFGKVIGRLNLTFGSEFDVFEHADTNVNELTSKARIHLSPSKDREKLKEILVSSYDSPELCEARAAAEAVFERMMLIRDRQKLALK